jgi:hypothetical protein
MPSTSCTGKEDGEHDMIMVIMVMRLAEERVNRFYVNGEVRRGE